MRLSLPLLLIIGGIAYAAYGSSSSRKPRTFAELDASMQRTLRDTYGAEAENMARLLGYIDAPVRIPKGWDRLSPEQREQLRKAYGSEAAAQAHILKTLQDAGIEEP
jgi:hypothetical protein